LKDPLEAYVKSAMRTLDIAEHVVRSSARPLVAQEIAQALSIPVSSPSYLLATLVERGYLARYSHHYTPGPGLGRLQASTPFSLAETVAPLVRTLRVQLNETSAFFVQREWVVETLVAEISEHALRYAVQAGSREPLHCLAVGKALLAAMAGDELDRYFATSERTVFTEATIVDEAELRDELGQSRARPVRSAMCRAGLA
jgi:IclR family acetate operon transcriptional repressor